MMTCRNRPFNVVVHHDAVEDGQDIEVEADVDHRKERMVELRFPENFSHQDQENHVGHELNDAGDAGDVNVEVVSLLSTPDNFRHQNSGLRRQVRLLQDVSEDDWVEDHLGNAEGDEIEEHCRQFAHREEKETKQSFTNADVFLQRPDKSLRNI